MSRLARVSQKARILGKQYNVLVDAINRVMPLSVVSKIETSSGTRTREKNDIGQNIFRATTMEVAQADLFISVKLQDRDGAVMGDAFDATLIATDGATAANAALPRIAASKTILITKIAGTWYVVNPTIIKSTVCA